jgi:hypothetical protein
VNFDAVLDELVEVGYLSLPIEGVAAGVQPGKAVLYRRWPGREIVLPCSAPTRARPAQRLLTASNKIRSVSTSEASLGPPRWVVALVRSPRV